MTNPRQLLAGPRLGALVGRLWAMTLASMAGTVIAAPLLTGGDTRLTTAALGAVLAGYGLFTLLVLLLRVAPRSERWLSPLVGLATGLIAGGTRFSSSPPCSYPQALGLEKDDLVQALGLSFTASTSALAVGLASRQAWQADQLLLSLLAIVPALIGMWAGQRLRRTISPARFKRWFLIALTLLGAEMLLRGLT
ncbi:sulfite exporter TauE/SafE family protein [Paracoccus sp. DMF-8]|uniref:sulfite exporter TauE/SafE family protein n=1 Tax=Paracoccus sp. DMF-8 TaxID=3019445 RepID=UPI0023E8EDC0|nr:sulfite exporter TauE/SafE family protein [Paracoccus sp. DMF-8]MDF3604696.1 sulfite exporter TauE/SafE family protein [Paracoccus sp. DMF-8]